MCQPRGVRCPSSAKKSLAQALKKKEEYTGDDPAVNRKLQVAVRKAMRDYHMTNEGQKALASQIDQASGDAKTVTRLTNELEKARAEGQVLQEASAQYTRTNQAKKSVNNFIEKHNAHDGIKPIFKDDGSVILVIDPEKTKMTHDELKEELKKSRLSFAHVEVLRETAQHWFSSVDPGEVYGGFSNSMLGGRPNHNKRLKKSIQREAERQAHEQRMMASEARIAQMRAEYAAQIANPSPSRELPDYSNHPVPNSYNTQPRKEWWEMTPEERTQFD